MEEQFLLKVIWITESNDSNRDTHLKRCQYFGPFGKKELDEKIEFYRHKARYGARNKRFEIFDAGSPRCILADEDGNLRDV